MNLSMEFPIEIILMGILFLNKFRRFYFKVSNTMYSIHKLIQFHIMSRYYIWYKC